LLRPDFLHEELDEAVQDGGVGNLGVDVGEARGGRGCLLGQVPRRARVGDQELGVRVLGRQLGRMFGRAGVQQDRRRVLLTPLQGPFVARVGDGHELTRWIGLVADDLAADEEPLELRVIHRRVVRVQTAIGQQTSRIALDAGEVMIVGVGRGVRDAAPTARARDIHADPVHRADQPLRVIIRQGALVHAHAALVRQVGMGIQDELVVQRHAGAHLGHDGIVVGMFRGRLQPRHGTLRPADAQQQPPQILARDVAAVLVANLLVAGHHARRARRAQRQVGPEQ